MSLDVTSPNYQLNNILDIVKSFSKLCKQQSNRLTCTLDSLVKDFATEIVKIIVLSRHRPVWSVTPKDAFCYEDSKVLYVQYFVKSNKMIKSFKANQVAHQALEQTYSGSNLN